MIKTEPKIFKVWWCEEDQAYVAIDVNIPGVSGFGKDMIEACEELAIARQLYLDVEREDEESDNT